jgi:hypothetical protein
MILLEAIWVSFQAYLVARVLLLCFRDSFLLGSCNNPAFLFSCIMSSIFEVHSICRDLVSPPTPLLDMIMMANMSSYQSCRDKHQS